MLPGLEMMGCQQSLAVPFEVMRHIITVESGSNPYAIGVVGGRLLRQPQNLDEAVATAQMLESKGYNYSLGIAQVNRVHFNEFGFDTPAKAFDVCANMTAGARILADCFRSAGGKSEDWGRAFSCYYSGDFSTGFSKGYVQRIFNAIAQASPKTASPATEAIEVIPVSASARAVALPAVDAAAYAVGVSAARQVAAQRGSIFHVSRAGRIAMRSQPLDKSAKAFVVPTMVMPGAHAAASAANSLAAAADQDPANVDSSAIQASAGNAKTEADGVATAPSAAPAPAPAQPPAAFSVFEPQVRGPNDAPSPVPGAPATPAAVGDPASPAKGREDSAFVF